MLTNGIQQTEEFNDYKSNHFTAVIKPVGSIVWTTNYYFGQEQPDGGEPEGPDGFFKVFDTYVAYTPTSAVSFGLDVNYVTNEVNKADAALALQGLGVYGRYQLSTPLALAVRYERLDDEGLFGGIDQLLQGITATVDTKFADGFLVRGEYRRDWSNRSFFHRRRARRPAARLPEHRPHRPGVVVRQQERCLVSEEVRRAAAGDDRPRARNLRRDARLRHAARPGLAPEPRNRNPT